MGQPLSQRAHIQVKQIVISTLESIQIILAMCKKRAKGAMSFDSEKYV